MERSEYDTRLRALDERLASSIEVLRTAHRVERRALDFLWMTSPANADPGVWPHHPVAATSAPGALSLVPPIALPPAPAPAAARPLRRWRSLDLETRVCELLDEVPEVFDREDLLALLKDNPPERSMLYRALEQLQHEGEIEIVERGAGSVPTRYRRAQPSAESASED